MRWVGLTYSLPSGSSSSPRVAVWRRQRQLGAVAPTGSLYLLPWSAETLEALEWLAQEIQQAGGEALVLSIDRLEGEAEKRLIELSRSARAEDYRKIAAEAEAAAEHLGGSRPGRADRASPRDALERLRRRFAEVARIDFFQAPEGARASAALARLEAGLGRGERTAPAVPPAEAARYRGRRWVTRPRPHVDRLASAWLIRRFIDPGAEIRYGDAPEEGDVSFDMRGAEFGHHGSRCTFETLIEAFGLGADPALAGLAEIVHEIDLRDGRSARPEIPGVDRILAGWATLGLPDREVERLGIALFEGLYAAGAEARSEKPAAAAGRPARRSASRRGAGRRKRR